MRRCQVAPGPRKLTRPTKYFEGQDELVRLLQSLGLNENDLITTVHLVARSLEAARL
jgi:hypothetical protein